MPAWLWLVIACSGTIVIWYKNRRLEPEYRQVIQQGEGNRVDSWLPLFMQLFRPWQQVLDSHPLLVTVRQSLLLLHGPAQAANRFRICVAEWGLMLAGGVMFGCLLAAVTDGSLANMLSGSLLGLVLVLARTKELLNRAERRRQDLQMELPELLSKVTLLVQAGETVHKALQTCLQRKAHQADHPLYEELGRMMKDIQHGYAFPQALEQLAKRCSVQEVSMFATTLLINQRRGGASFVLAMEDLARQLWEKRKSLARKRGEEVSTKLIFPVMIMFLVVLLLVGGPAFMMM